MGDLLHLRDAHERAQLLLPWHVNGTLDSAEAAWFEAHLTQCAECRADLETSQALQGHLASLPLEIEPVRPAAFDRIAEEKRTAGTARNFLRRRVALGWALAGQAAIAATAAVLFFFVAPPPEERGYRLLDSQESAAQGNAIVLFAPDTTERDLREALVENEARLVDGPTASGAYVVRVAAPNRDEALDRLRQLPQVILAEPIDGEAAP